MPRRVTWFADARHTEGVASFGQGRLGSEGAGACEGDLFAPRMPVLMGEIRGEGGSGYYGGRILAVLPGVPGRVEV